MQLVSIFIKRQRRDCAFFPLHSQIAINQANIERESRCYGTCHSSLNATTTAAAASHRQQVRM